MSDTPKVLISDSLAEDCVRVLEEHGCEAIYAPGIPLDELAAALDGVQGLLIRSRTQVTAELIQAAPSLRVVGRAGSGVDNVDIAAASAAHICVMNTPGGNTRSVAEHAMGLIFAMLRHIPEADATMTAGQWEKKRLMGREVRGKRLAIVGPGKIGQELAVMARGCGMDPHGVHHAPSQEKADAVGMPLQLLAEALPHADIVSLHVPGKGGTEHLINAETIEQMKDGAWIVNCARGNVIDEAALLAALDSGKLSGAALDVFPAEPPPADSPLRAHPKVLCTPHIAASTREAQERVALAIAEQAADYLVNGNAVNAVNAEALSH
ncbi:MAG: hydroxyacid dehydrogenase [Planctomycetota bacterium]|jgi:D-3-phosphoglycerate dehydrogenase